MTAIFSFSPVSADWGPDTRLSDTTGDSGYPSVVVSGNTVHVIWQERVLDSHKYAIYYRRSTDGGANWSAVMVLLAGADNAPFPSMAVSGDAVHVVWSYRLASGEIEIFYSRSTDGGVSWMVPARLTFAGPTSTFPSIAVFGNNVHVAWSFSRETNEIRYIHSPDGGTTWEAIKGLIGSDGRPVMAVSGDNVHIVWEDARNVYLALYYNRSINNGANWGTDTPLTDNTSIPRQPSVAVSGNTVCVAWWDMRDGTSQIFFRRSADNGVNWEDETSFDPGTADSAFPSIAAYGNDIHVAWYDLRDGSSQVYYKLSTDGGANWADDTRLSDSGQGSHLSVAAYLDNVHVVWQDDRDSNNEIYYKRYCSCPVPVASFAASATSGCAPLKVRFINTTAENSTSALYWDFNGDGAWDITGDPAPSYTYSKPGTYNVTLMAMNGFGSDNATAAITVRNCQSGASTDGGRRWDNYAKWQETENAPTGSSSITGSLPPPAQLPNIVVQRASLSAATAGPDVPVTVTALIGNTGTANGVKTVKVYVNGREDAATGIAVNLGQTRNMTFTVSRGEPGTYSVYVDGTPAGSFTVSDTSSSTLVLVTSAAAILAAIAGLIYMVRRRQSQY